MSIKRLTELVPPPESPTDVGTPEQWTAVEKNLGLKLPRDYRQFVFKYGSGLFAGHYVVYNPFSTSKYIYLVNDVCEIERQRRRLEGDKEVPYPVFPDKGGILPWGRDENGNDYYWLTEGAPSKWKVVQNNVRGNGYAQHDCTMTEFLVGILDGRIKPLASGYPNSESFVFQPRVPKPAASAKRVRR